MNIIKFIKHAKSLDVDELQVVRDALSTKLNAAEVYTSEWTNLTVQRDAVSDLLRKKLRTKLDSTVLGSPEWVKTFHQLMAI